MNIKDVFSSELYDSNEFYNYFSENEICNIPFDLYNLIEVEQKTENEFIFQNFIEFISDLYVSSNVNDKDFEYIDLKLEEIGFSKKFSEYLYSDFLIKKEGAIFALAKMRKTSNCKYLEAAFIDEYYKKNPILTSICLKELFYLKSKKADEYEKLIFEDIDLINFISIILINDDELSKKALDLYKNENFFKNIKIDDLENFACNFEVFVKNVQNVNKIRDFTRDEYLKCFDYFGKIYYSYKVEDFYSFYKKALQDMEIKWKI